MYIIKLMVLYKYFLDIIDCKCIIKAIILLPPPSLIFKGLKNINFGEIPFGDIIEKNIIISNNDDFVISYKVDINSSKDIYSILPRTGQIIPKEDVKFTVFINTNKTEIGKEYNTKVGILNQTNDNYDIILNISSKVVEPKPDLVMDEESESEESEYEEITDENGNKIMRKKSISSIEDEEKIKRRKKKNQHKLRKNKLMEEGNYISGLNSKNLKYIDEETGEEIVEELEVFVDSDGKIIDTSKIILDKNNGYIDDKGVYHKLYKIPTDTFKITVNENGDYVDVNGEILKDEDFVRDENNNIKYIYTTEDGKIIDVSKIKLDENNGYIDESGNYIVVKKVPQLIKSKIRKSTIIKKKKEEYLNINFKMY